MRAIMTANYSLIAKLARPKVPGVLPRNRLLTLLDEGRDQPITWISGPAGSGKTTLAADYIDARKLPCLWYQIDAGDSDLATFFYYLGLATRKAAPRFKKTLPLLTPEYLQGLSVFTQRFFEKLYARLRPPFALVFDNYQEALEQAPLHELVSQGLSHMPEGIRVLVLSRTDPPPAFMRLRANNIMRVIGWDELRFTIDESKQMLRRNAKQKLSEKSLEELYTKTEGWAAGLVLLRESAGTTKPGPRVAGAFDQREVFAYFASEVLEKLDSETRDFLLMTSFLPAMTARMAEKMTDQDNAGRILAGLNRSHFFTEKHEAAEPSYQYHPLFREFLLMRMKESLTQAGITHLQKKASVLLASGGQIEDTITLLVEARDWNGLVPLILSRAASLISQGRSGTLEKWIAEVPRDMFEKTPWILYWHALCRFPFNYQESRTLCEKAFSLFRQGGDVAGALLAWAIVADSIVYEFGELKLFDPWIKALHEILKEHPDFPSPEIEFRVVSSMAVALMFRKVPHAEVSPWVARAQDLTMDNANVDYKVRTSTYTSLYYAWLGELGRAKRIVEDQERWAQQPGASAMSRISAKYSIALYQWIAAEGDFGMKAALDGIAESFDTGAIYALHHLHARKVFAALNMNDLPVAKDAWDTMSSGALGKERIHIFQYHYVPAWIALLDGDFSEAGQQAEHSLRILTDAGGSAFHRCFSHITSALAMIGENDFNGASEHLSEGLRIALAMKSRMLEFTCLLFTAYLHFEREKTGESDDGLRTLREALALGRDQGYMNTVVWYPRAMPDLCAKALENGIEVAYVRTFIARRNIVPQRSVLHVESWPWPLKIKTLGKFELVRDDHPLSFSGKVQQKPLALLKALIAFGGMDVPEARISDALWPDADGDLAHRSFEMAVHRLRKLIGHDGTIQFQERRLSLDPNLCWVDAWAFEQLISETERGKSGEPARTAKGRERKSHSSPIPRGSDSPVHRLLEKAIDVYKGHFLPSDSVHPWALTYRERMRSKFLRAVIKLGTHWEQAKRWEGAVEVFQKGLEVDNRSEDFYQHLMLCHQRLGQRGEAITVYKHCCELLSSTLGIAPSPRTEELYRAIIKGQ